MKRREFVASVIAGGVAAPVFAADDHQHDRVEGSNANATVSFGFWTQFDRFNNPPGPDPMTQPGGPNDRTKNGHALIPHVAKIKAGGSVNFIIAGFHQVIVYGPGTDPAEINATLTTTVGVPPGPPLIDDPTNRVFRGVDPSRQPTQDRVEIGRAHV